MSGDADRSSSGQGRKPDPFTLVIFGASGDLAHRKLVPAVFALFCEGLLGERFDIVGYARSENDDDGFRKSLRESIGRHAREGFRDDEDAWRRFAPHLRYVRADYDKAPGYRDLSVLLEKLAKREDRPDNRLFYCSTPPEVFPRIMSRLREHGLARREETRPWSRIIVEKPFGRDLDSARELNRQVSRAFDESQIFRIDHYLGKETTQNILVFRFANSIFEPIWNQKYVDHVQITVAETLGVGDRGGYYDRAGALRDIVQNHMIQLLCLVAMESPNMLGADDVRDEKVKVVEALRRIPPSCVPDEVVRARYTVGEIDGEKVRGYLDEDGVAEDSQTETFVALKAFVDNWRWAGVPFYLRTGKRLPRRMTGISIHFKSVPNILFNTGLRAPMQPNVLWLRIQPDEGIALRFQVKVPGAPTKIRPHLMDFAYGQAFGAEPPDAYERLLLDAALGDSTLFARCDEIEAAWAFVTPVLEGCDRKVCPVLPTYAAGTWGPDEAKRMIEKDGREWLNE